uniref:NACHT, LRR and PYD domains-containing protein 3-like n=1 Tax=Gasterosteus aculeatus aculeatus TaxID=481459 RepID=UPI001A999CC2|nr:NACHT, LRR and PYD domains-containing protein 3-like [Gasterosteus aculeatus aculeatus]
MDKVKKYLINILVELKEEEFKEFKWHLRDPPSPEDFRAIPACPLQNADRRKTVDLMVRYHGSDSVDLAKEVLETIPRMDLIQKFDKTASSRSKEEHEGE